MHRHTGPTHEPTDIDYFVRRLTRCWGPSEMSPDVIRMSGDRGRPTYKHTHTGLWAHRTATSLAPSLPQTHTHTQSLSIYFNWILSLLCATLTQTEKPSGSSTAWDQISKPSGLMLINPTLLTRSLCQLICLILRYHPDCFTYVIQVPLKPCWGSKSPWNKASAGGKTPSGALITSTCRHNCAYQTPPS